MTKHQNKPQVYKSVNTNQGSKVHGHHPTRSPRNYLLYRQYPSHKQTTYRIWEKSSNAWKSTDLSSRKKMHFLSMIC